MDEVNNRIRDTICINVCNNFLDPRTLSVVGSKSWGEARHRDID
ncbi:MAG: hypothetical protein ACO3NN_09050 [Candidatus Puniceispirillales bacterium]